MSKIEKEKHFQILFGKYILSEKIFCAYELKISHGNTINFNCFQPQQLPSLYRAYHEGLNIKYTDASLGLKHFDGICYKGPAYVGIMFNIPNNQKEFYLIGIDEVLKLKSEGNKSISKEYCKKWGVSYRFGKSWPKDAMPCEEEKYEL